jgi:hypothetical protein
MWTDRRTLIGIVGTGAFLGSLALSVDGGANWTHPNSTSFGGGISGVHFMYDGELLVFAGYNPGVSPGQLYRSTGWQANPATATFAVVATASGGVDAYFAPTWGFSSYGKIVVVNEYGPKASFTDMARYSRLSTDGGATWSIVFDLQAQCLALNQPAGWDGTNAHLHGCAYDPWWDAIWICNGDYAEPNPKVWLSFDRGTTWQVVYTKHQYTSVIPLPNCILFGTDEGSGANNGLGNGIFRIPRQSREVLSIQAALIENTAGGAQTIVGSRSSRYALVSDPPTLLTFSGGSDADRLYVTYDGYTFKQIYLGSVSPQGIQFAVGPTTTGLIRGWWQNASTFQLLTVTPG